MTGHRSCSFYRLCPLLLQEAQLMETRVSSDNLCKDVIRTTSATQRKLEETWDDVGEISTGHSFACVIPFTCPATECVQIAIDVIFLWFLCVEQLVMCIVSLMMTLFWLVPDICVLFRVSFKFTKTLEKRNSMAVRLRVSCVVIIATVLCVPMV